MVRKSKGSRTFHWVVGSHKWKDHISLDVLRIFIAEESFTSNPIQKNNVKVLKESFLTHGVARQANQKLHAVCFLGVFIPFFFIWVIRLFANLFLITDGRCRGSDLTLERAYELGIYVFCGQHELVALKELAAEYPDDPQYQSLDFDTLCVFRERNPKVMHKLRIAGNFHNYVGDLHQVRTWVTQVKNCRIFFNVNGCRAFNLKDKVFFFFLFFLCEYCFLTI